MGKSRVMKKKGWVDSQGRKGKGYGVYKVRRTAFPLGVFFPLVLSSSPPPSEDTANSPPLPPLNQKLPNPKKQFEDKYGANVDGYSPIYTPDLWSESGDTYRLGTRGLIAWAGLVVVLLGVGLTLIVSTSQIGA